MSHRLPGRKAERPRQTYCFLITSRSLATKPQGRISPATADSPHAVIPCYLVLAIGLLPPALCQTVLPDDYHQRRHAAPAGFQVLSAAPAEETITLRVALAYANFSGLEKALYSASTPGTEQFGRCLNREEVGPFIAPSEGTITAVAGWLSSNGIAVSEYSQDRDGITVEATVAQANKLLRENYTSYKHADLEGPISRTFSYSLPPELKTSVGLQNQESIPESCIPNADDESTMNWMKPYGLPCSFDLHKIPFAGPALPMEGNSLWLSGFENAFVHRNTSRAFLEHWRPDLPGRQLFDLVTIKGGMNNQLPGGQHLIVDQEMWRLLSTAANVPVTFMSLEYLLKLEHPPKVLVHNRPFAERRADPVLARSAYFWTPSSCTTSSLSFVRRLCEGYAKLAARGVSRPPTALPVRTANFDGTFPASCPYVTSVGGSEVQDGYETPSPGIVSNSGGFSNLFPRPLYQDSAVRTFLEQLEDGVYQGRYDPSGRATPDVVLHQWIARDASEEISFGTPAFAAALFAGAIALLNDELLAAGKPVLGFLNPWMYQNMDAFTDLTVGDNPGCNTQGFSATSGWDPLANEVLDVQVTGLGSFNYATFRKAAGL
ncbi:Pro-kumamolisin, activation domain-containing protein [Pterulicium gracile]|uniref:Pro-kumamolisin, activation domain-containing protein n=1 Tax=Pterulicium gracile TaxID=1884261 RepID=A0A5C3QBF0_9AGAR|nr:Pro-kumamolisin, activation domain-containing protein [Pterula gracilis]